jgi:vacuolar protein sorting-associated protein 13D
MKIFPPNSSPSDKKVISSNNENPDQTDQPVLPEESPKEYTKIVFLQFAIDQLSLEVQSRGRSIAELQVTGVKAGYSQRAIETNFTLSVHGLLLVDAMQSFGPDFELLVASHKHVG